MPAVFSERRDEVSGQFARSTANCRGCFLVARDFPPACPSRARRTADGNPAVARSIHLEAIGEDSMILWSRWPIIVKHPAELIVVPNLSGTPATATAPAAALPPTAQGEPHEHLRVSPVAHKLAADLGVDLAQVRGTGPQGAITREDVERTLAPPRPQQPLLPKKSIAPPRCARRSPGNGAVEARNPSLLSVGDHRQGRGAGLVARRK
jgi:pyruvate/2-oxoglutarate dehydrogenase complex dihydrolipoamide acyltransferase (E2) component